MKTKLFLLIASILLVTGIMSFNDNTKTSNTQTPFEGPPYAELETAETNAKGPVYPITSYDKLDTAMGLGGNLTLTAGLNNAYYLTESNEEYVYFYLNLTASDYTPPQDPLPLNLSLVIDRSGSMGGEKMANVIKAAKLVVDKLRPTDKVSVVSYDGEVVVEWPNGAVQNKGAIKEKVGALYSRGSTFLEGGMMEGYREAIKGYSKEYLNRVMLMSDGQATDGETDPTVLGKKAMNWYNEKNISISTFGVGLDYNENLMTTVAENGRGNYYFIANSNNIAAIFEQELNGLLTTLAKNIEVEITLPEGYFEFSEMYGFSPKVVGNKVTVTLHDLLASDTRTILMKCRKIKTPTGPVNFATSVSYTKAYGDKTPETLKMTSTLNPTTDGELYTSRLQKTVYQALMLFEANKNYEEATKLVDQQQYDKAAVTLALNRDMFDLNASYLTDSSVVLIMKQSDSYAGSLDSIKTMDTEEYKYMQKSNKMNVYSNSRGN